MKVWARAGLLRTQLSSAASSNTAGGGGGGSGNGGAPVVAVLWSADSTQVLWAAGKWVYVRAVGQQSGASGASSSGAQQGSSSGSHGGSLQWRAHDACITAVDWSPFSRLIVTAGEDGRYRVWDQYGRQLYSAAVSAPVAAPGLSVDMAAAPMPVLSLAWNPQGTHFACGSFDAVRVCDRAGVRLFFWSV